MASDTKDTKAGVQECIRDAEEALNSGALLAEAAGETELREAFLRTRSYFRKQIREPSL